MGGANTNTLRLSHRSPSQPALSTDSHHLSRDRTRSPMSRREHQHQQQQLQQQQQQQQQQSSRGHHGVGGASSRSLSPPQMRGRETSNPWGVRVPPRPESSSAIANSPKKRQLPQLPGELFKVAMSRGLPFRCLISPLK